MTPAVPTLETVRWLNSRKQVGHGFGLRLDTLGCHWKTLGDLPTQTVAGRRFYESPALIGCALAIDRSLYHELRGFDPQMRMWGVEDLDFGLKSWLMGYPVLHDPQAVIGHRFRQAFDNYRVPAEHLIANQLRCAYKHFTPPVWDQWREACRRRYDAPVAGTGAGLWSRAWRVFEEQRPSAEEERQFLQQRRSRDEFWYAQTFGLEWPRKVQGAGPSEEALAPLPPELEETEAWRVAPLRTQARSAFALVPSPEPSPSPPPGSSSGSDSTSGSSSSSDEESSGSFSSDSEDSSTSEESSSSESESESSGESSSSDESGSSSGSSESSGSESSGGSSSSFLSSGSSGSSASSGQSGTSSGSSESDASSSASQEPSEDNSDSSSGCAVEDVSIVIGTSSNTGPGYITAGNTISLNAQLTPDDVALPPDEEVVWEVVSKPSGSPAVPVPSPTSQSLSMSLPTSSDYPGEYEISVTVCSHQASITVSAFRVALKSVTYSGASFHQVIRDSNAGSNAEYAAPHFQAEDTATSTPEVSKPVCFVRNTQMQLELEFTLEGEGQPPSAEVRAMGTDLPRGEIYHLPETSATVDADSLTVPATGLQHPVTSDPELLPDSIENLSLEFEYECHLPDDGDAWTAAGTSNNTVYVTLDTPHSVLLANTFLCETLLEISCTAAAGKTNRLAAYWPIHDKFASLDVSRVDGARLTYYIPGDKTYVESDNGNPASPSILRASTQTILLATAVDGAVFVNCVGFSYFFTSCLIAHGMPGVSIQMIESNAPAATAYPNALKGVVVKNWTFGAADSPGAAPYSWKKDAAAVDEFGIAGHNNDDPPSVFLNHFIVEFDVSDAGIPDLNWIIFDPSYGRSAWSREQFEFGSGAYIAGLCIFPTDTDDVFIKTKSTDAFLGSELKYTEQFISSP